jgi:tetratricopeptide (TPR) repeat protein
MTTLSLAIRSPLRPRRFRPAGIVLSALLVAAGSYGAAWLRGHGTSTAAPGSIAGTTDPRPAAGQLQDPAPPADLAAIDTQIAIWGPKAAADAGDDLSAGNLAILYLGRGRLTGDAADYDRARAAADRAVTANPTATGTRTLRATVLQATHDFPGALALATQILAEEPGNVDALAVAGDAQLELGRLVDAAASYAAIGKVLPGAALDARLARLAWLSGDGAAALTLATRARDVAAREGSLDPSFYEAQLGELARATGNASVARAAFDAALAIRPTNQLALLGRARLAAFTGDTAAAIRDLRTATAIAPRPETLALLGDLLARSGDAAGAADATATIEVIERLGGTSAVLFDRQLLLFDLDHRAVTPDDLARARAAVEVRPDAAGHDLVAWAAFRLGNLAEARQASDRALATGTADARILAHAGTIRAAAGDREEGRALLRRALALGPALDPLERSAAEAALSGS